MDQSQSSHNSLEEILKDLEEKFGVGGDGHGKDEGKPNFKKSKGINFKRMTQSQIIGGLTLVLLVVGAAVGMYLGNQNQEIRQQAAYSTCLSGNCSTPGGQCTVPGGTINAGTCQLSQVDSSCTCIAPTPTLAPVACTASGTSCDTAHQACPNNVPAQGTCVNNGVSGVCCPPLACVASFCYFSYEDCSPPMTIINDSTCANQTRCVCGSGGATAVPTQTNTPQPTAVPTGNPLPTNPPATITPLPTAVPTNPPVPTNTPTRTPSPLPTSTPGGPTFTPTRTPSSSPTRTPSPGLTATFTPAPTCNGITMTYGGTSEPARPVRIGDNVYFTCLTPGAYRYEFQIFLNGIFLQNILPVSTQSQVSASVRIDYSGTYSAQCRMCTDSTANSCQLWEPLP